MRLIDADTLIADCQLAQKQADRHGREFANAFYSGGGEISTEWWCVEDMIDNAPTIEERKTGKVIVKSTGDRSYWVCDQCRTVIKSTDNFCRNCGADLRGEQE